MDAHVNGPGSAAEEAAALFAAAQEWLRTRSHGLGEDLRHGEHLATGSAECSICPLCQTISAVRQVRPETVEHLLDAVASVVAALRSTIGPEAARTPDGRGGVQHIDVREG